MTSPDPTQALRELMRQYLGKAVAFTVRACERAEFGKGSADWDINEQAIVERILMELPQQLEALASPALGETAASTLRTSSTGSGAVFRAGSSRDTEGR